MRIFVVTCRDTGKRMRFTHFRDAVRTASQLLASGYRVRLRRVVGQDRRPNGKR